MFNESSSPVKEASAAGQSTASRQPNGVTAAQSGKNRFAMHAEGLVAGEISGVHLVSKLIDTSVMDQREFLSALMTLSVPFISLICNVIESSENWEKFVTLPSSVRGHHSEIGGNLRHTLEVAHNCMKIASLYKDVINEDVLMTAALLHDIGKIYCYEAGNIYQWKHTEANQLLGHKLLGAAPVLFHLNRCRDIPNGQKLGLIHCLIASSTPRADQRSPACFEAEILIKADQLSAAGDLYRKSYAARGGKAGFGLHHPHQRQTPFHIGGSLPPTPTPKSKSRFGFTAAKPRGAM